MCVRCNNVRMLFSIPHGLAHEGKVFESAFPPSFLDFVTVDSQPQHTDKSSHVHLGLLTY